MRDTLRAYRGLVGPVVVVLLFGAGLLWSPFEPHGDPMAADLPLAPVPRWDDADWSAFAETVRWATDARVDTLPIGDAMAAIGRSLVGTPYVPHTLEVEGPERLVIDFRGLDCVTLVENVMATARFVKGGGAARLADRGRAEVAYETLLREIRYRGGVIDGYPSRLHYFSDWIWDNAARGRVADLTAQLGGVVDAEPVDFMTTHRDAYRQLAGPDAFEAVGLVERAITKRGRHYIPEERIADVANGIRDGDVIAATSTVRGLDVAHTGLALWVDGELHLLHAPLVGDSVQISERTLADRIRAIDGQDGILVARPLEASGRTEGSPDGGGA